MSDSLRIALLADFKFDTLRSVTINARKIAKGLILNGHDVLPISYRNLLMQHAPVPSRTFAQRFTKDHTDRFCCELLQNYRPDVVLVLSFRSFNAQTLFRLRDVAPDALFAGWYEDSLDGVDAPFVDCCKHLHWIMATGVGERLDNLVRRCGIRGAFMPNPCDPDMEKAYPVAPDERRKLLFIGKVSHRTRGTDESRAALLTALQNQAGLEILGNNKDTVVFGLDYYRAICSADINLSINASNDIPLYHSDRLIQLLACGAFVVARWVPQSDRLFADRDHLCYFNNDDECFARIAEFADDPQSRQRIGGQARQMAHDQFNGRRITRDMIDLITTGDYDAPWKSIVVCESENR